MYLMSVADLAEYLGESKRTIYRYLQSGDCPRYIRLTARNIKFDKRDVDAWLEARKVHPPGSARVSTASNKEEGGPETCPPNQKERAKR